MTGTACLDNIRGRHKNLTNTERRVADYILSLDEYTELLSYTVTELAEKADVSDATVVRFCRSVGYKGYQDFKINLAKDTIEPRKHMNSALEETDSPSMIADKVFRSQIQALEESIALLDLEELETVAKLIKNAEHVFIFGSGGSIMVAHDALHKFLKIGIQCIVEQDGDIQVMESALTTDKDVAIGISHSGTNRNVIECMKNAKENGSITVGMTSFGKAPLHRFCDHLLMTSTKETVFKSESVTGRISQLAVIDSLVAIISFMDYDTAYEAIQKTRSATSDRKF